jgi:transposase
MTPGEEEAFMGGFGEAAGGASMVTATAVREALEKKLGRKVHPSTAYRLLHRHGWRKVAPRPRHPRQDPKAAEAFKKGGTRRR